MFRALMNNYDQVSDLVKVAADSTGSATKRMEIYLDSVEAKTNQLKATWEEFVMDLGQSKSYKSFLDFCIWILNNMPSVIGYITSLIILFKGNTIAKKINDLFGADGKLKKKLNELKTSFSIVRTGAYRTADGIYTVASAEKTTAAATSLLTVGLSALIAVISLGVQAYNSWKQANVEAARKASEEAESYNEKAKAMENTIDKYKEIFNSGADYNTKQEQLKQLSSDLTEAYGKEAEALDLLNGSYENNIKAMEDAARKKRKQELSSLKIASDKGESNLDNWINLGNYGETSVKGSISSADKQKVMDFIYGIAGDDIRYTTSSAIYNGYKKKDDVGDYDIKGMEFNYAITNEQAHKYSQDIKEYIEKNIDSLSQETRDTLSALADQMISEADKDAEEQFKNKQKYQLAKLTTNEDGSFRQEIQDYESQLKKQKELEEKYNKEINANKREELKKKLAEEYELTEQALQKVKSLYNSGDANQSTLSEKVLLDYLGFSDNSASKTSQNIYVGLKQIGKIEDYKKIRNEIENTGKLSEDAGKKLAELKRLLYGQENGETFVETLNNDLDNIANASKINLDKDVLLTEYNAIQGSENQEEKLTNWIGKINNSLSKLGVSPEGYFIKQWEQGLKNGTLSFETFYNNIVNYCKKLGINLEDVTVKEEKLGNNLLQLNYQNSGGTDTAFKKQIDETSNLYSIADRVEEGKASYDDIRHLTDNYDEFLKTIEKGNKITGKQVKNFADKMVDDINKDLDKMIENAEDFADTLEEIMERASKNITKDNNKMAESLEKAMDDAGQEAEEALKNKDVELKFVDPTKVSGDLEMIKEKFDEINVAANDAGVSTQFFSTAIDLANTETQQEIIDGIVESISSLDEEEWNNIYTNEEMQAMLQNLQTEFQNLDSETQGVLIELGLFDEQGNILKPTTENLSGALSTLSGNFSNLGANAQSAAASILSAAYSQIVMNKAANGATDDSITNLSGKVLRTASVAAGGTASEGKARKYANNASREKSGGGGSKGSSGSSYSAEDAAKDLKDILNDIEKYEQDIELDLKDQTEELLNQYNLRRNQLDTLKEELDYYDSIYDVTENTSKWLTTQLDILDEESKKVAEIQKSTDKIEKQRQKIYDENSNLNVASWFDSEGNETLAYGDLLNSFEYRKNEIEKQTAAAMRDIYNSVSGSTDKDTISDAKERIKLVKEENENRIKAIDKEKEYVENVYSSVSQLNDAWKDNRDAVREALQEMNDRVKSIRDELVDDIMEQLERAVDKMNTSIEKDVTRMEQLVQIQESYNSLLNDTIETQQSLDDELRANMDTYQYLDEQMRQLMFNEDDYKQLSKVLDGVQEDIANIWEDHYKQINDLTEDEMYKAQYITNETERQLAAKQKEYDLARAELEVAKAQTNLQNVLNERNTRIYADGEWSWVANPDSVKQARQELADQEREKTRIEREREQQSLIDSMNKIIDSDNLQIDKNNDLLEKIQEAIELQTQEVKTIEEALLNADAAGLPALQDVLQGALGKDGGYMKELLQEINHSTKELGIALRGQTVEQAINQLKSNSMSKGEFEELTKRLGFSFNPTTGVITTQDGSFVAHYAGWTPQSNADTQLTTAANGVQVTGQSGTNSIASVQAEQQVQQANADLEQIARDVWLGKWGNGQDRKNRLTAAGYDYYAVQALVNKGRSYFFDQGGIAGNFGLMAKDTIEPERVLSPRQTKAFETLVENLTTNPVLNALSKVPAVSSVLNGFGGSTDNSVCYNFKDFVIQADNIQEFINSIETMMPMQKK